MFTQLLAAIAAVYGVLAALITLLQTRQMLARRSSCDVSARFLVSYAGGYGIWLAYGLSTGSIPLIVVDTVGLLCAGLTLAVALSLRGSLSARPPGAAAHDPPPPEERDGQHQRGILRRSGRHRLGPVRARGQRRGLVKRYGSREAVAGIAVQVRRERSSPSSARTARARPRRLRSSLGSPSHARIGPRSSAAPRSACRK